MTALLVHLLASLPLLIHTLLVKKVWQGLLQIEGKTVLHHFTPHTKSLKQQQQQQGKCKLSGP